MGVMKLLDLSGKVALITGGSRGPGLRGDKCALQHAALRENSRSARLLDR